MGSLTSAVSGIAGSLPVLTKSPSGSSVIDAVVANKAAAPAPTAFVDVVADTNVDINNPGVIDGKTDATWVLLAAQKSGVNGIYKNIGGKLVWQGYGPIYIGVTGGYYRDSIFQRNESEPIYYQQISGSPRVWTKENSGPAAPYTAAPILTMLTEPTLKNTGIMNPEDLANLPAVDIVATPLTASGLNIKPIYLIAGVIALVVAYFVWKKYGK